MRKKEHEHRTPLLILFLLDIVALIRWFFRHLFSRKRLRFLYKGETVMALTLNTIQSAPITLEEVDAKGGKVAVVGPVVWSVSDPAVFTIEPAADGLSAVVTAVAVGAGVVTAVADGLTGTLDVSVVAAPGVALNLIPGTPTP
jgi:hypothetical protein